MWGDGMKLSQVRQKLWRMTWFRWSFWTILFLSAGILLGGVAAYFVIWRGAQFDDLEKLKSHKPMVYSRIYDRNGNLLDIISEEQRIILDYEDIPEDFVYALVAVEDEHFFHHIGVSPFGIIAAVKDNFTNRRPRGASTLTQQLVKNITKDKRYSYARKLKEQFLAVQLESRFTKEEIFAMYVNEVPFGNNQFGLAAAADYYFGKSVGALSLVECALLAGIPQAPSRFNPYRNPEACINKRNIVLERMAVEGYISKEEVDEARKAPLELRDRRSRQTATPVAAHFVDKVRSYLFDKYGEDVVRTSGWDIHTTLDLDLQRIAEGAVQEGLKGVDKTLGYRHYDAPSVFKADEEPTQETLDQYFDPTWHRPLQEGISIRGLVIGVAEEAIQVRVKDRVFTLTKDNVHWIGSRIKDLQKYFKQGDVPLFRVIPADGSVSVSLQNYLDEEAGQTLGINEEEEVQEEPAEEVAETAPEEEVAAEESPEEAFPFTLELDQEPDIEGAFMATDVHTGDILAMVGGYDYRRSKFNRAEQARRQVGSAFKPIIFGAALERGYTLADTLFDEPTLFVDPTQFIIDEQGEIQVRTRNAAQARRMRLGLIPKPTPYEPHNYYNRYVGQVTLRSALEQSKNIVSVKLMNSVGYDHVLDYVHRMKLYNENLQPFPSMALGAFEMSLQEVTYAYATFANSGVRYEPRFVSLIMDAKGRVIEENPSKGEQIISPQNAYLVTDAMKSVIFGPKGSGWRGKSLGYPHLAGKTGTTNDYADAWFIGYSPNIAAGVWVGRDLKHTIGRNRAGANTAQPIWVKFFEKIKDRLPDRPFAMPEGLVKTPIDRQTGTKFTRDCECNESDVILETFLRGTEPVEICTPNDKVMMNLPWYLQKRTYQYDRESGRMAPNVVIVDTASQQRALDLIRTFRPEEIN